MNILLVPLLFGIFISLLLASCGHQPNQVRHYHGEPVDAQSIVAERARFTNLFPSGEFPAHCEGLCYAPREELLCEAPAENCRYRGELARAENPETGIEVHWLGHASFRVQFAEGQTLLFDPVFGQFDWPIDWLAALTGIGMREPGQQLAQEETASVDAVLYSHAHYDHFSRRDVRNIGQGADYFVPYGMARYFPRGGYRVHEMAWYSRSELKGLTVHALPAQHFHGRGLEFNGFSLEFTDFNKAHWAGWLVEQGGHSVYFAGDTGYSPIFREINQRYGGIDVCLMPIASYYGPNYRNVHMTPEDALVAADELQCKLMIPWGYGNASWQMGDRNSHGPLLRLLHMYERLQPEVKLLVLNEGESAQL